MLVKAEYKTDGRNVRLTFSGTYVRVVTKTARGVNVAKYPINNVSGSVVIQAVSDNPRDTAFDVAYSPRLPQLGSAYVDERGHVHGDVFFKDFSPRFVGAYGGGYLWEITYTVEGTTSNSTVDTQDGNEDATTILNFSAQIEQTDVASAVDFDGKWNVNSLGLFFEDPLIFKSGILALNYSRREYSNPLLKLAGFTNTINATTVWWCPPRTLRVADITTTITETEASTTYDVSYKLAYKPDGWDLVKPNSSYYVRSGNTFSRALNTDGSPTDSPVFIATDGTRLTTGTPPSRSFRVYPLADLNLLNLPDPRLL